MTKINAPLIIVSPVYEDLEAVGHLLKELTGQVEQAIYVVLVDDGSLDHPLDLSVFQSAGLDGTILKLKRNVGHQRAIAIGLGYVAELIDDGQQILIMDSDGEDKPSTIQNLLDLLAPENVDVVVARRRKRVETLRFKAFYAVYKLFFRLMTGQTLNFGNFMALKAHAVKRLVSMQELSIHIAGSVMASKLRTKTCPLDRGARYAGQSKMNFVGLALHGFKALMVFAEDVMARVSLASMAIAGLSISGILAAVVLKSTGFSTPGWFSVALGILFLILLQTAALSLMTLMLTGVMRASNVTAKLVYHDFIDEILTTSKQAKK